MILSDRDIRKLIVDGILIVDPLKDSQIGPTSIDLHLGNLLVKYNVQTIELGKSFPQAIEFEIDSIEPAGGFRPPDRQTRPGEIPPG